MAEKLRIGIVGTGGIAHAHMRQYMQMEDVEIVGASDIVPGKARDFMLRVTASGENEIVFTGAEAFEGEEGSLEPPGDGETVVYFFTETAADVLLVARKRVERIENE